MAERPNPKLRKRAADFLAANRKLPRIPAGHRRIEGHYERHDDVFLTGEEILNDLNSRSPKWRHERGIRRLTEFTAKRSALIRECLVLAHEDDDESAVNNLSVLLLESVEAEAAARRLVAELDAATEDATAPVA